MRRPSLFYRMVDRWFASRPDWRRRAQENIALADKLGAEVERLRGDCAEAYQVIGSLAINPLPPDHRDISRALDNMSAAASGEPRPHNDLLPFPRQP